MSATWLQIDDDGHTWNFDRQFLESNWTCIWNQGCAGIGAEADPDAQLGCCSVGAEMLDVEEAMRISAIGATLNPATTQFASDIAEGGALRQVHSDRATWATRVVDGACIFLNRPGFEGGEGCALHRAAEGEAGESYIDWKPSICWQLPIKIDRNDQETSTLRGWLRSDWGPGGSDMAYCCTERDSTAADAFVGDRPVVDSLRDELVALLGDDLYEKLKAALG